MTADSPTRLVYEASLEMYSRSESGDEQVPAVEPEEYWEVIRPQRVEPESTLWPALIKFDLYSLGLGEYWRIPTRVELLGVDGWRDRVKQAVLLRESVRRQRQVQLQPILRTYSTLRSFDELQLQSYLTVPHGGWKDPRLAGRRALTRLRTGANDLRINTGRWEGLPIAERICELCVKSVETEQHFLLDCSFFADQRTELWDQLDRLVNSVRTIDADGAADPPFRIHLRTESALTQLTLMTGGSHPRITTKSLYQRVTSMVMVAIAQWVKLRKRDLSIPTALVSR